MKHALGILIAVLVWLSFHVVWAEPEGFVIGSLKTRGNYTRFMVAYTNQTSKTYHHLTIQCVGFLDNGLPVGESQNIWDTRLNDRPIAPGKTVYHEMMIRHGGAVIASVQCEVIKAKSR